MNDNAYILRLMPLNTTLGTGGLEIFRNPVELGERIESLGLSVARLDLALSVLRNEDKVIWFDCDIPDHTFAGFARPSAATV